jgi:hypothetical protein
VDAAGSEPFPAVELGNNSFEASEFADEKLPS